MMIKNENNLSRNRKERFLRRILRIEDDDRLIKLRNAIKYAKRKKIFNKFKKLENELVKINYANNPSKLQD